MTEKYLFNKVSVIREQSGQKGKVHDQGVCVNRKGKVSLELYGCTS